MPSLHGETIEHIAARYAPALKTYQIEGTHHLGWLLLHDWTLSDTDREEIVRALLGPYWRSTRRARADAERIVESPTSDSDFCQWIEAISAEHHTQHTLCDDCGKWVIRCRGCGECPGGDDGYTLQACLYCTECHSRCERCARCHDCSECECSHCSACSEACESTCSCCDACESCCECSYCASCDEPCESPCACSSDEYYDYEHSGYCASCCESARSNEGGPGRIRATGAMHPAEHPRDRRLFNSRRLAGLEVELFGIKRFRPIKEWAKAWGAAVHSDGSVTADGYECVTAPAAGDYLIRQIERMANAIRESRAECDESCGVHVHVDARDMAWSDVARLVRLWDRLEPAMYVLAGQDRYENQYCQPWGSTFCDYLEQFPGDTRAAILNALYSKTDGESVPDAKAHICQRWRSRGDGPGKKSSFRYHSLNLAPWIARVTRRHEYRLRDGVRVHRKERKSDATIEFRLHEGCHDRAELQHWARICVHIVDYVASATDHDVDALPRSAMRALARIIAPDCAAWITRKVRAWHSSNTRTDRVFGYMPNVGYVPGFVPMRRDWRGQISMAPVVQFDPVYTAPMSRTGTEGEY